MRSLSQKWLNFWFHSNQPLAFKTFRQSFALLALLAYSVRSLDLFFYFSDDGILPLDAVQKIFSMQARTSLFFYFTSQSALVILNGLFLLSLLALFLGIWPNLAALLAYILHVSFIHRNLPQSYGFDFISTFFFFYLIAADTRASSRPNNWRSGLSSVAMRLIQIQFAVIYFYAGLDKVRGPSWWSGEALWTVLANWQLARGDFSVLAQFPLVIVFLTYSTLLWEIYFPVLVWIKPLRHWVLLFGVLLHLGIALGLGLGFFGFLMIVGYLVFLEDSTIQRGNSFAKKFIKSFG